MGQPSKMSCASFSQFSLIATTFSWQSVGESDGATTGLAEGEGDGCEVVGLKVVGMGVVG